MTLTARTKEIEGVTYAVAQVNTSTGLRMGARCLNILAPALKNMPAEDKGTEERIAAFLGELLSNPNLDEHLISFATTFAAKTQVIVSDTKSFELSQQYETHFAGNYSAWLAWFQFAFEVNMSSFLGILSPALNAARAMATKGGSSSESPSPVATSG